MEKFITLTHLKKALQSLIVKFSRETESLSQEIESLPKVAKTGNYNDLTNKPDFNTIEDNIHSAISSEIPQNISDLYNDVGYITSTDTTNFMVKGTDYVTAGRQSGTTLGQEATAEGVQTIASGNHSHAEGYGTLASNIESHAEGNHTTASGLHAHAEGGVTTASGNCSHAEGNNADASGSYSHAEGYYTRASGNSSHTEGNSTIASGSCSHAEGNNVEASGNYSHAEGYYTQALRRSQHVFGEYNRLDNTVGSDGTEKGQYIEIVGKGTSALARSNARTLDWSGNETLAGKLSLGAGPTTIMDAATKGYVDTAISGITIPVTSVNGQTGDVSLTIPTVPTNISDFTNDAGYQTSTQVNSAITTAIGNINSFDVEVVTSTSSVTTPNNHTIYFVPQAVNSSTHDEYMYINNTWELIGTTTVDLSGYLQKTEIADWAKAANKPTYTASEVGAMSTSHAAAAITSANITAWNNKSDFSGSYNDLTNKPTIPAAQVQSDWNATTGMGVILNKPTIPTVPTNVSSFTNDAGYLTLADLPIYDGTVQNG